MDAVFGRVEIGPVSVIALSRHGGFSQTPYESLNLGSYVGDKPENVTANFAKVKQLVGAKNLTYLNAKHGIQVNLALDTSSEINMAPDGDGLVCVTSGHAIVALSADCVPFALVDPVNQIIAVGHAGWKGVLANLMNSLTEVFKKSGGQPAMSTAVIGPSICAKCYEVPEDRVELFSTTMPAAIADSTHLNLPNAVGTVLSDFGFSIIHIPGCNFENQNLFSFRRSGGNATGRGGLVAIINADEK